jgi:hypothetical protein
MSRRFFVAATLVALVSSLTAAALLGRRMSCSGEVASRLGDEGESEEHETVGRRGVDRPAIGSAPVREKVAEPAAAADRQSLFKAYHAELCLFSVAYLRSLIAESSAPLQVSSARTSATRACDTATAQVRPVTPTLDRSLAALTRLLSHSEDPNALAVDEPWKQLARALASWSTDERSRHPSDPSEGARLGNAAIERARAIVLAVAADERAWPDPPAQAALRDSVVELARYGSRQPPDAWATVVEPALEGLMREMRIGRGAPWDNNLPKDVSRPAVLRAYMALIEARHRAASAALASF